PDILAARNGGGIPTLLNTCGVTPAADLAVTASISDDHVTAGDIVEGTLTITNHGPGRATNILFDGDDIVGTELYFLSLAINDVVSNEDCAVPTLEPDTSATITATFQVYGAGTHVTI